MLWWEAFVWICFTSRVHLHEHRRLHFIILLEQEDEKRTGIEHYAGLAGRHALIALAMTIFLLSLAGIPPLAGFMGKFYVLSAAIQAKYYWLAVIGVLNSVVAAYYYLRGGDVHVFPGIRR